MPDFWTHIIGGEKVLEGIDDPAFKAMVEERKELYHFGCQGPDFFFYNDYWPWKGSKRGPEAGRRLQLENTEELFLRSTDFLKASVVRNEFPLSMIHFSGFLTHYVFDKTIHPFVNSRVSSPPEHKVLEMLIDCFFANKYRGKEAYQLCPVTAIDLNGKLPPVVVEYFSMILNRVYGYPRNVGFIQDSYQDMKQVLQLFYFPGWKPGRIFFTILNLFISHDINMLIYPIKPDYSKFSAKDWEEIERLFNKAVEESIELLGIVFDFLEDRLNKEQLSAAFPKENFDGN